MFGRVVFARRYLKIIVAILVAIPIFYLAVILFSGPESYPLKLVHEKLPSIKDVNDYLKKVDTKGYISGALNSVSSSGKYEDDDEMFKTPENDDTKEKEEEAQKKTQKHLSYLNKDGSLNVDFFYKPSHNKSQKAQTLQDNNRLYKATLKKPILEPKVGNLTYASPEYQLANATFLSLVRNSEIDGIISAITEVEATFNSKFHYPWTFINDVDFTEEFKNKVKDVVSGESHFITIDPELWKKPAFIDEKIQKQKVAEMIEKGVGYADMESYHNMCRFYSGTFYNLPHLQKFRYYWRVEPDTKYFCQVDYDVFKFMQDNNKVYGFNINVYDGAETVKTLWNTTIEFLKKNPQYLNPNGAFDWLKEDAQNPQKSNVADYSTCHFWSNFEIADMNFFRGEAYSKWFKHLDEAGGFYYERWGDAPVHSLGLALFEDKSRIHWFKDIGYEHFPYFNCPNSDKCDGRCKVAKFVPWSNLNTENCMANWIKYGHSEDEKNMF